MKVLFVTSESAPFAKTGGLGDVSAALPAALAAKRVAVRVMMPLYGSIAESWRSKMRFVKYTYVSLGWRNVYCGLFELKHQDVTYYFLDNEYYFRRDDLYGHFDDGERFAFFSKAVVSMLPELGWVPDVLHCNDWQTALIPLYLREFPPLQPVPGTIFTIHNIEYQGRYSADLLGDLFGLPESYFNGGTLEFNGGLNLMKGAIELSDAVTTVSPTYARELQYSFYAMGLEGVISAQRDKTHGILNGIDMTVYNPETDDNLACPYSAEKPEGKRANKLELQKILGLRVNPGIPIVGIISRLVPHKGIDLVEQALDAIMDLDLQFAVIGRGDWRFEELFRRMQRTYPGRFSSSIMYNESLAMQVYAGSDILLMPSRAEPCGLSQMIAMRYGTVPVVRETGGLKDTVSAYKPESGAGRGFTFANYTAGDMLNALKQAVSLYDRDAGAWNALSVHDMGIDFSWKASAQQYLTLYRDVSGAR